MFNVRITSMLNTISAYWHMVGVAFIVLVCIVVPDHHQSFAYVFTGTLNNSGFSGTRRTTSSPIMFWYVFGLGLLMSQYTITGFDASAHMAEETHQPPAWRPSGCTCRSSRRSSSGGSCCSPSRSRSPTQGALVTAGSDRRLDLAGVDEPELGRDPALHLLRRADVLPDRVGHVGVADDVRVLARRRSAGHTGGGGRSAATASRTTPSVAIGVLSGR